MPENIERKLGPWGSIISAFLLVISFFADISGLFVNHKMVVEAVMIISAIAVAGFAVYLVILFRKYSNRTKKYDELERENTELKNNLAKKDNDIGDLTQYKELYKNEKKRSEALELLVCDGKRFTDNKATIYFDIKQQKYYLSFEKRYFILTDAIKWYEGQFYSNVTLESAEKSQEFYKDNQVPWETLNISAELKYKNIDDKDFSQMNQVSVLHVAEGNNYKKYHIQYMTREGDNLNIRKGAEIVLNYSYEVPVRLWGSYLNRSVSYWDEPATVKVRCKDGKKIQEDLFKVYETSSINGEKVKCDNVKKTREHIRGVYEMTFVLPRKGPAHYCVWWDAEQIFGVEGINTKMTADHSQLTAY